MKREGHCGMNEMNAHLYDEEEVGHIFRPKVQTVLEFGHKGSEWDSVYPSKKELKLLPLSQKI